VIVAGNFNCCLALLARKVLAVPVAYGALLGCFAWKLAAFKTVRHAFLVGAVADLAKPIFPRNTAHITVWACATCHLGALLACNTANSNFHTLLLLCCEKHLPAYQDFGNYFCLVNEEVVALFFVFLGFVWAAAFWC
jgi:hypothetical protein